MQAAFANALRRGQGVQARCLGLNLQTLTVGHLFLLEEQDCAFPYRYENATLGDLVLGVLICSQKHRSARRFLRAWWTPLFMRCWQRFTRKHSLREAAETFQEYLILQLDTPKDNSRGTGEVKVPLPFRLLAMLMADFHLTKKQALDTPVNEALCLWATEADRRGAISLLSERQLGFYVWAEQQEKERLAKEGASRTGQEEEEGSK